MLEFLVVYLLGRRNAAVAQGKGRSSTTYWILTVALWFGCEVAGFVIGSSAAEDFMAVYMIAIAGAVTGGVVSYLIASTISVVGANRPWIVTHVVPQQGLPIWARPKPSLPPTGVLPPGTQLSLAGIEGGWAFVLGANGDYGWVNGQFLIPVGPLPAQPSQPYGNAPSI